MLPQKLKGQPPKHVVACDRNKKLPKKANFFTLLTHLYFEVSEVIISQFFSFKILFLF
jgi:hypothetical protein